MVEYEPDSWKLFEPSKFIYSYFSFNTFYSVDWKASIENKQVINYQFSENDAENISEFNKIKNLIEFIHEHLTREQLIQCLQEIRFNMPLDRVILELENIQPDSRISQSDKDEFIKAFKQAFENQNLTARGHKKLIRLISSVRNNIFHGTKDIIQMSDSKQRIRLKIYTQVLTLTNSLLFLALRNVTPELEVPSEFRIRL